MMKLLKFLVLFAFCTAGLGQRANAVALAVQRKIDLIETGKTRPGSSIWFTEAELNAWARFKVPQIVPDGVRSPRLQLNSGGATAYGLIDFVRARKGQGEDTNWLVSKLIEGEKPVTVTARIDSAGGKARVHLTRVDIGGVTVTGPTLDFIIETFFRPFFPDAEIDEWFDLPTNFDRLEITPRFVRALIGAKNLASDKSLVNCVLRAQGVGREGSFRVGLLGSGVWRQNSRDLEDTTSTP